MIRPFGQSISRGRGPPCDANTGLEQWQSRGGSQVQADHESIAADLRSLRRPPLIFFGVKGDKGVQGFEFGTECKYKLFVKQFLVI